MRPSLRPSLRPSFLRKLTLQRILLGLILAPIHAYRFLVSPLLGVNCRFVPSCSCYALEALCVHGILKGGTLALKRVSKCHPFRMRGRGGAGDHFEADPVPRRAPLKHAKKASRGERLR